METPEYLKMLDKAADCIFVADGEGRILDANSAGCAMLGYSRDELRGMAANEFFAADGPNEACLDPPANGEPSIGRRKIRRQDGTVVLVEISGILLPTGHYVGIVRDLTQQQQVEEELRSTLAWFHLVVAQVPAILWTTDTQLRFTSGMGAALESLDLGGRSAAGLTMQEYFGTDDPEFPPLRAHLRAMQGQSTVYEHQWQGRTFDTYVEPLRDRSGKIIGAIGLSQDVTERKRAELQLQQAKDELERKVAQRTQELSQANEELRQEQKLLREMLELHERDRRVLAYEIHDGLVQYITGALMRLEAFEQNSPVGQPPRWEEFQISVGLLRDTVGEARRLISGLRPPILDEAGVGASIEYLVSEHRETTGMQVESQVSIPSERLATPLETALFRIAQESLTNIRRHSRAKRARVELTQVDGSIRLIVQDWGIGFRPESVGENRYGLRGIRERVRLLGGQCQIESTPGEGTTVRVQLPVIGQPSEP